MGPTDFDSNLTQTGLKYITDRNKIKDEFYLRCFIILGPYLLEIFSLLENMNLTHAKLCAHHNQTHA